MRIVGYRLLKRFGPVVTMLVAFAVGMAVPAEAAKKSKRSFFNSVEVRSANLKPFKKWRAALKRDAVEQKGKKKGKACASNRLKTRNYGD